MRSEKCETCGKYKDGESTLKATYITTYCKRIEDLNAEVKSLASENAAARAREQYAIDKAVCDFKEIADAAILHLVQENIAVEKTTSALLVERRTLHTKLVAALSAQNAVTETKRVLSEFSYTDADVVVKLPL